MNCRTFIKGIFLIFLFALPCCAVSGPLGGETGNFVVSSDPIGAEVWFDGNYEGTTAVTIPVSSTGTPSHTVTIKMEGYETWTKNYYQNPQPGYPVLVSPQLTRENPVPVPTTYPTVTWTPTHVQPIGGEKGYFSVSSSPSGADVTFDGSYKGDTPVNVEVYTTSSPSHTISISKNGYKTWKQNYNYNPGQGQTVYVDAALEPLQTTGSVYVTANPSGAYAVIDGGYQRNTPCTFDGVSAGYHTIQVAMAGYKTYSTSVSVNSGEQTNVNAVLEPQQTTGSLQIYSSPSYADVYVDGSYKGETPVTVSGLSTGRHTVKLQLSGYQTYSSTVTVNSGQSTSINPTLTPYPPEPKTGDIAVSSYPSGAYVYIDGNYKGITRENSVLDLTDISPGSHTVLLEHPYYQDYRETVRVSAGKTTSISATLKSSTEPTPEPSTGIVVANSDPSGANFYIENQYKGVTPVTLYDVPSGSHEVMLRLSGYADYTTTLQVTGGQTTQFTAALQKSVPEPTVPQTTLPTPEPTKSGMAPVLGLIAVSLVLLMFFEVKKN